MRRGHLREGGQRRGRHAQQLAPFAPVPHQRVDGATELLGVEADLAAQQQQFGRTVVVLAVGRQAEVGNAAGEVEQVHQLVRARAGRESGCIGALVVVDRLDQRAGEAPVEEQRGGELVVVGLQVLLFELGQAVGRIGMLEQLAVGRGIHGGEREPAHLRQQAAGEQLLTRAGVRHRAELLHGQRHQQRVRPERLVVESRAGAVLVLVDQREAHRQVAHRAHAQTQDGVGHGGDRSPGAERGSVGLADQPARQRRVGLGDVGDLGDGGVFAPAQLQNGERHPFRAGEFAIEAGCVRASSFRCGRGLGAEPARYPIRHAGHVHNSRDCPRPPFSGGARAPRSRRRAPAG